MSTKLPGSSNCKYRPGTELCIRMGKTIFGVSFTSMEHARRAAKQLVQAGHDIEIYERHSGRLVGTWE